MKLVNILLSQVVRLFKISSPRGGSIYGGNLARAIESRYGFLQGPRTIAEYDSRNGITFLHGFFEGRFVIDKLQIFETGVLAETRVPTEECDLFLDDAIQWARQEAGVVIEEQEGGVRAYQSQLEVQADFSLEALFKRQFVYFCRQITDALHSYGQNPPDFGVSGIAFHGDFAKKSLLQSGIFNFERRVEQPYDSNLYFSTAPLRTDDHLRLLNELEKALLA